MSKLPSITIPMMRRTFPELITNEIVGVQPMSGPVGLVFALKYRYSNELEIGVCIVKYGEEDNVINLPYAVVGRETKTGMIRIMRCNPDKSLEGKLMGRKRFDETFFEEAL